MQNLAEKNDVEISKLFQWSKTFIISDPDGNEILTGFMKIVGDSDLNKARVVALRESAALRKLLKDKNSDEYNAYIPDLSGIPEENVIELILAQSMAEFSRKAMNTIRPAFPKEPPSDASLEEQEKYQEQVDKWPENRMNTITKAVEKEVEKEKKRLQKLSKEELDEIYINNTTNGLCESTMVNAFKSMIAYLGFFKDDEFKERLFSSFEEFNSLPSPIKKSFIDLYHDLELETDELKKLLVATH